MSYAIICDARKGESLGIEVLALVDRSKSKRLWWTSDDAGIAIQYIKLDAARFACKRLRRNNARVVPFADAKRMLHGQSNEIMHNEAMSDTEAGWDGHK